MLVLPAFVYIRLVRRYGERFWIEPRTAWRSGIEAAYDGHTVLVKLKGNSDD